jgi:AcrR family transcriptional regulator
MARPKSDEKRSAILSAAANVIASDGLSAATARIAKDAGVSNGSFFTYFETKADLLNALYLEIKEEMAAGALDGLPAGDIREQMLHVWSRWLRWAMSSPEKRRTLAHLNISDDITEQSREAGHKIMAGVARLLERCRESGAMRDAPLAFVVALMNAIGETTIDFMIRDPKNAKKHSKAGFDAFWRAVA